MAGALVGIQWSVQRELLCEPPAVLDVDQAAPAATPLKMRESLVRKTDHLKTEHVEPFLKHDAPFWIDLRSAAPWKLLTCTPSCHE